MKKLLALALVLTTLATTPAHAGILGDRFDFGISGAFGVGTLLDATPTEDAENYTTISWLLHAGLKLTPRWRARLSVGVDDYFDFADTSDTRDLTSEDGLLFTGDLDAMFYPFKNSIPLLSPYLVAGVGYPRALHAGAGLDVSFGGMFGLFGEVTYGTAFIDHRGTGRLGLKIKF